MARVKEFGGAGARLRVVAADTLAARLPTRFGDAIGQGAEERSALIDRFEQRLCPR